VIQFANGAIHAGCHHAGCGGGKQRWQELRKMHDPEYAEREKQEAGQQQSAGQGQEANEAGQQERQYAGREQNTKRTRSQENQNTGQDRATEDGQYAGWEQRSTSSVSSEPPPPIEYALTDAGNAERLIAHYGETVRYCATSDSWFIWNGRVWEEDISRRMLLLATDVARSIYAGALQAATPERARQLARWAIASESLRHRKALIESAAPHAAVTHEVFDAKPHLLNLGNGTLELDTLHFREHRREDLLTKCAPVAYDKDADCPLWKDHLSLIFDGDTEYITGFQAMCGYTLLQDNPEQVLFILFGRGRNGKSKTIEVLAEILGDYAVNIAAESLMVHRYEGARSDLARMAGARMATASEGEDGARLAESMVKQLTGEYAITVRRLYENEFEFTPTAKIWLTTNHEPVIRGTDDGIWRRIWMVPFTVQIPEEKRDPGIAEKLLAEGPGILNWCLEGLQLYYANGNRLIKPGKVSVATGNYRTLSDTIGYFLATECTLELGCMLSRLAFRERFEKWCEEEGIRQRISARRVASVLKSHGIKSGGKSGAERFWDGIRWKTESEREAIEQKGSIQECLFGVAGG
jgi:putative DNA primase/helicase